MGGVRAGPEASSTAAVEGSARLSPVDLRIGAVTGRGHHSRPSPGCPDPAVAVDASPSGPCPRQRAYQRGGLDRAGPPRSVASRGPSRTVASGPLLANSLIVFCWVVGL